MYAFGIPAGMMVDAKSPRWGLTLGIVLLGFGYYPIAKGTVRGVARFQDEALLTGSQHMMLGRHITVCH